MKATYLLRFDDICSSANWEVWEKVEAVLLEHHILPLVAVVPNNQDESLRVSSPDCRFWDRVRRWQSLGWTIGMHGYQHRFVTADPGIVGLNNYSEFAGISRYEQQLKLESALALFRNEYVEPVIWVAPAHSFDNVTVELLRESGICNISDGFYYAPNVDSIGMMWFPQQLWSFRWRPFGVWTICFHINSWREKEILDFRKNVRRYRAAISSFQLIRDKYSDRKRRPADDVFAAAYLFVGARVFALRERLRWIGTTCSKLLPHKVAACGGAPQE
jgi:predicted deacetylase